MLTFLAILIPVLLGVLGLVLDNGQLFTRQRQMQAAADAAALAAAQELRKENYTGYRAPALKDAALNGFEASNAAVAINVPPMSGPRAGDPAFVEAVISQEVPLTFMRALGRTSAVVEARAVAGLRSGNACVYALSETSSKALWVTGTANVTLEDCGVLVNSDSATAAVTNGKATVETGMIGVVGGYSGSGFTPTPETGIPPTTDPLALLDPPSFGACTYTSLVKVHNERTLAPGVYCGGLEVTSTGNVTLNPGTYVLYGGGLTLRGGSRLAGAGVTFYLTAGPGYRYGPVDFAGNSTALLSAPANGPYKGILFFQDRAIHSNVVNHFAGTSSSSFTGVLYFKNSPIDFVGTSSTAVQNISIIADTITFRGTTTFASLDAGSGSLPPLMAVARVME